MNGQGGGDLLELAELALSQVTGDGQVTVVGRRSLTTPFARSRPTRSTAVDDVSVEFLCWADGHVAGASTSRLDRQSLHDGARRAANGAQAAARMSGASGEHPGPAAPAPLRPHAGYDPATAELDGARAGTALAGAFAAARAQGLEAFGLWSAAEVSTVIVSSTGLRVRDRVTQAHMRVTCRDERGRSGLATHAAVSSAALAGAELAERAAARVDRREPIPVAPGEYPVVLESEAVATLLKFLGTLAFNGLAHVEGRGALSGRLGTRVAAPCVSLSDSPRYVGGLPRAFDAEGVPKAPLPLIQDGVAHRVVHDLHSAARAGRDIRSTGHALRAGGAPAGPEPVNLVLLGGGSTDAEELCRPIRRGLYVSRLSHVSAVHERHTLLTGVSRDGTFLIEDGRIAAPAQDVRFTDSALRILQATEALSSTPRLVSATDSCAQPFLQASMCPALRAQGFCVTAGGPQS